ncbi:hypothetical protein AGLY_007625 [Aphis glycines]|uniref:ZSWIM1/3 RNaseH-like domain-containing protein n=1 Tax=Aphis glycines TaxID=307491 RepID=A0A6G0TNE8_APHGL|nr:hypothetical protein AGLY_007625 [Aphis glycines]
MFLKVVFADATYILLDLRLPVYVLITEDGNRQSEKAAIGLLVNEEEITLRWFFKTFLKKNPISAKTRVYVTDKDMKERNVIKKVFPNAALTIFLFHTLRTFNRELTCDKRNITSNERDAVKELIQNIVYCKSELEYENLYQNLKTSTRKVFKNVEVVVSDSDTTVTTLHRKKKKIPTTHEQFRKATLIEIPWVPLTFYMTRQLTGHGCFEWYLHRMNRAASPRCWQCSGESDTVEHTLFECPYWDGFREALSARIGRRPSTGDVPDIICGPAFELLPADAHGKDAILKETKERFRLFYGMVENILSAKEEERVRQAANRRNSP